MMIQIFKFEMKIILEQEKDNRLFEIREKCGKKIHVILKINSLYKNSSFFTLESGIRLFIEDN